MVTYLAALRFAANIEDRLDALQRRRFATVGDVSARALPPLIPLAAGHTLPRSGELDRIRKQNPVWFAGQRVVNTAVQVPARISLTATDTTLVDIAGLAAALTPPLAPETAGILPPRPAIVLSWNDRHGTVEGPSPAPLPDTAALWLSVIELRTPTRDGPWWEYLSWTERFRRRLTVVRRP